jgi:tRNA A-37 threonylcarbamoyl transferase component Bud32
MRILATRSIDHTQHTTVVAADDAVRPRLRRSSTLPDDIQRLARPMGTGYAVGAFSRACLIRLIDFPEMPLKTHTNEIIKASRSTLLVRTELSVDGRMIPVSYKRVTRKGWLKRLSGMLRINRTFKTWNMARKFHELDIATAKPLAVIVPRKTALRRPTFVVHEWIEGAWDLHAYAGRLERLDERRKNMRSRSVAESLGRLLGHLHASNISHRDLKETNLLMVERGTEVEAYVIDLDGAATRRRIPRALRLKNLARLGVSVEALPPVGRAVKLRFLKAYLSRADDPTWDWKTVWRDLTEQTVAMSARKRRKRKRAA